MRRRTWWVRGAALMQMQGADLARVAQRVYFRLRRLRTLEESRVPPPAAPVLSPKDGDR